MLKSNPLTLLKLWGVLTVIAITIAVVNFLSDHFYFMILSTAILMTFIFIYQWISYRIDGSSYTKGFDDERLCQVSFYTLRNSSLYFFVSIWLLAIVLSFPSFEFLKEHISAVLAMIVVLGMLIHAVSFTWRKYRV
ncbi:MAG TPA: hypothetical protein VN426_05945 [Syntrophomonadaceae bacterium]|nr:hypothetical protein [Syntrophomonadaceae bacterium]